MPIRNSHRCPTSASPDMRFDTPVLRQCAAAIVAASIATSVPTLPAHAEIGALLPQNQKFAPDPSALNAFKLDDAPKDADVTINLKKGINPIALVTKVNPVDPVGSINNVVSQLPKSIGVTLPIVNIPLRVDLAISVQKTSPSDVAAADVVVDLPKGTRIGAAFLSFRCRDIA